jgi:hypothetical protein
MNIENNEIFKKQGTLRDIFAATPLGRKGREALFALGIHMTPNEFLEQMYVEPFKSLKEDKLPDEDRGFTYDEYIGETKYSDIGKNGLDLRKINRLGVEKNNFEKLFKDTFSKALYIIKGSAGCGKTTYFYRLMYDMPNNEDVNFYPCDLEKSTETSNFLTVPIEFDRNNNVWIFVGFILQEILHKIFYEETLDENKNDITNRFIKKIVDVYDNNLNVIDSISPRRDDLKQSIIFEKLKEYINDDIKRNVFFNDFGNFVISEIAKIRDDHQQKKEEKEKLAVQFVMGFAIRMFFCLSKIDEKKKRYICAIDSVEHYIYYQGKRRLQNKEIETIVDGVKSAADSIRPRLDELREIDQNYNPFYAIVIMMRDTSETIIEYTSQQNEFGSQDTVEVDISEWFDAKSIIEKRERYFTRFIDSISEKEQIIKLVIDNVKSDTSIYRWGLHGLITRMYNNNYRGITDCLVETLKLKSIEELNWFNTKWNEAIKQHSQSLKHMCRQYIFRVLLDYIEDTQYFDQIMAAVNGNKQDEKTSYARRISTILYNWSLANDKKFLSFPNLVQSVLVSKEGCALSDTQIKDLGEILWLMNIPDTEKTHWSALVEIRFDPTEVFDKDSLIKILQDEWHDKQNKSEIERNNAKKYGVRLRTSGSFLADIVPEFEYFACRSVSFGKYKHFPPLFEVENLTKNESGEYRCILIIQSIFIQSLMCIDNIIKWESSISVDKLKWLFSRISTANAQVHPLRIFRQHIGYLEKYCDYVEKHIPDDICCQQDRDSIVRSIKIQISQYEKQLEFRKNKYSNYFNAGVKNDNLL